MNGWRNTWYRRRGWSIVLAPLSALYGIAVVVRRRRLCSMQCWQSPVPVVVVGNITAGGSGKTPVVIALVEWLQRNGHHPAVISRGYGGRPHVLPLVVEDDTPAAEAGDEPLLIRRRTGCTVVVDPDRVGAARVALAGTNCDIIVTDDGLQHYRLARDIEIAVVDGLHGVGNGHLLPVGPLRESLSRLDEVDCVLVKGGGEPMAAASVPRWHFHLAGDELCPLLPSVRQPPLPGACIHAIAAIAWPEAFFERLARLGYAVIRHWYRDHAALGHDSIVFGDGLDVVMTEKDAVKCVAFAGPEHWYLPVMAQLPQAFWSWFGHHLETVYRERLNAP